MACDHTQMRWSNFADSHWYLDAMGVKAANGYSAFCRQDFVGIDYGMIDCSTYAPLPDYYSGILWSTLMSTEVLQAESSDPTLRSYAHCSAKSTGQLTVLLINLEATMARTVTLAGLELGGLSAPKADGGGGEVVVTEWHLTGPNGTASTEMALNGELLVAKVVSGGTEYELPSLEGRPRKIQTVAMAEDAVDGVLQVEMAAASIAFVELPAPASMARVCHGAQ